MNEETNGGSREPTAVEVQNALRKFSNREKAAFFPRFFKSDPDNRSEGDLFIGVTVPQQRAVAKEFRDLPLEELEKLLAESTHEFRLTALIILVNRFTRSKGDDEKTRLKDFYLAHLEAVNYWDLVDVSAHKILGEWLVDRSPAERLAVLEPLAESDEWSRQRVAVVACFPLIRRSQFSEILWLAETFIAHPHDLIQKAVGWMLREAGKRDLEILRVFLQEHAAVMPRVMLRYSIEKMAPEERKRWLRWKR
ncbi:MAG: DNA alkylation repair protein [Verrucomicrobiales bacterium]|nr:DNA alkylation repair protein [Verrucomicrobiales bacterium]